MRSRSQTPTSPHTQQPPSDPQARQSTVQDTSRAGQGHRLTTAEVLEAPVTSYIERQQSNWRQRSGGDQEIAIPRVDEALNLMATEMGGVRVRILGLLSQSPPPHYTRDATAVLERTWEKLQSWIERNELMFSVETSFMIAPRRTTHEAPNLEGLLANLANGYNAQDPPPRILLLPRYAYDHPRLGRDPHPHAWMFCSPTEFPLPPPLDRAGNCISPTTQNMIFKLTKFHREGHITLASFFCIYSMASRRGKTVVIYERALHNSGSPPF